MNGSTFLMLLAANLALVSADIRFTTKDVAVYAIVLGTPEKDIAIKSLGTTAGLFEGPIGKVELLGSDQVLQWTQTADAMTIKLPTGHLSTAAVSFKISPSAGR